MTQATDDDEFFWAAAGERRLVVQGCGACGVLRHPPSPLCRSCGSADRVAVEVSGRGRLYSWTLPRHPILQPGPVRIAALVHLDEGPRLVTALEGAELDDLALDAPVEVDFAEVGGRLVPVFRLVA